LNLGLPSHIHGYTVNRACTSSLQTIVNAATHIKWGHPTLQIAGGVECLSDVPIPYSDEARKFLVKLSKAKTTAAKINMLRNFSSSAWLPKPPSLDEPLTGLTMGEHAEIMAKLNVVNQADQDALAVRSHKNAARAREAGIFAKEIVPIWPRPNYKECIDQDNIIRPDTSVEAMSGLKPAFDRQYGTITAGNASPLTDGAAAVLITDQQRAKDLGLKPLSRIVDFTFVGVTPTEQLLIGPAIAIPLLLRQNKLSVQDIDLFEIHEAFAAQACAVNKDMGWDPTKVNVNGGAIAIGHPIGASGGRVLVTLLHEMQKRDAKKGLATLCIGGGMGIALCVER
jgi:acetyl-CoA acyltransferase